MIAVASFRAPLPPQEVLPPHASTCMPAAAAHVLKEFYSKPYDTPPPTASAAYYMDIESVYGVERPNHGLADAVRKALFVPVIAGAYRKDFKGGDGFSQQSFAFEPNMTEAMQAQPASLPITPRPDRPPPSLPSSVGVTFTLSSPGGDAVRGVRPQVRHRPRRRPFGLHGLPHDVVQRVRRLRQASIAQPDRRRHLHGGARAHVHVAKV